MLCWPKCWLPNNYYNTFNRACILYFNQANYGIKAKHPLFPQHVLNFDDTDCVCVASRVKSFTVWCWLCLCVCACVVCWGEGPSVVHHGWVWLPGEAFRPAQLLPDPLLLHPGPDRLLHPLASEGPERRRWKHTHTPDSDFHCTLYILSNSPFILLWGASHCRPHFITFAWVLGYIWRTGIHFHSHSSWSLRVYRRWFIFSWSADRVSTAKQ